MSFALLHISSRFDSKLVINGKGLFESCLCVCVCVCVCVCACAHGLYLLFEAS